jgi:hypothetical protein
MVVEQKIQLTEDKKLENYGCKRGPIQFLYMSS